MIVADHSGCLLVIDLTDYCSSTMRVKTKNLECVFKDHTFLLFCSAEFWSKDSKTFGKRTKQIYPRKRGTVAE